MKATAIVTMGVGVEMKGVIEDDKGRDGSGSKSTVMLDEGGVEVLNEIGIGSFTDDELGIRGRIMIIRHCAGVECMAPRQHIMNQRFLITWRLLQGTFIVY